MTCSPTSSPLVLSAPQRSVIECLCVGGRSGSTAIERSTGAGPETLSSLVALGLVERRDAGARDSMFHATDVGRSLIHSPIESEDTMTETAEKTETTTAGDLAGAAKTDPKPTPTAKKTAAAKKPAATKKTPAKKTAGGDVADVTGQGNAELPQTAGGGSRSTLSKPVQAKVDAAVVGVVPADHDFHKQAMRYGTKVAKQEKGLRSSPPPLSGLSKETGAAISAAVKAAIA